MSENQSIADEMRQEAANIEAEFMMPAAVRRKKLIRWAVRQGVAVFLYVILWDKHPWVPLSLWVAVPLAVLSLAAVLLYNPFLKWRLRKAQGTFQQLDDALESTEETSS